jgi:DNA polymerase III sliding clamp (beta) subunit (PCNA family)
MRLEFTKKDLQEAIDIASISLASNGKDISSHYLFRVFNDTVEILTYSGRIFSSTPFKAKVENAIDHNQFTIEAKRLKMWLQSVNEGDALAFEFNGSHVKAISPKGTGKYQSQDTSLFPFWDTIFVDSKETITIESSRLHAALSYAKFFVSDQESRSPHLCVVEFKNGSLYASDQVSVCLVQMPGTAGSSLRVHGKDLSGVLNYLSNFEDSVTVLEHERAAFIKSSTGHVFGISKFNSAFPELNIPIDSQDTQTWTFSKMDFLTGIQFLSSCAAWEDTKLTVEASGETKGMRLTMKSSGGDSVEYPVALAGFESQLGDSSSFQVSHPYLQKALSHFVGDTVSMGVNPKGKGGWLRFKETKGQDNYLTIVAWLMG